MSLRIVVDSSIPYMADGMPLGVEAHYLPSGEITADAVAEADALMIRSVTRCDRALLEGSAVRLITSATAGFDHIDTDYCREAGIRWYNAPGCNAASVAQYVLTAISRIALEEGLAPEDITLGIIGTGHTGGRVYQRAKALGMRTLLYDPPLVAAYDEHPDWQSYLEELDSKGLPRPYLAEAMPALRGSYVELETLLSSATIITCHVPLTKGGAYPTYHLVDDAFLRSAQQRPWLINACRGAVVDTAALVRAIDDKAVSGAVIDCWEGEPHIAQALLDRVFIGTPHIAGFSVHGKAQGAVQSLRHLCDFFGLSEERIALAHPRPLAEPYLDLSGCDPWQMPWRAMLHTLDLPAIMHRLVATPDTFEQQRVHYQHPYEPRDYTVRGVPASVRPALAALGFVVEND